MQANTDVATPTSWKCIVTGILQILIGLPILGSAGLVVYLAFNPSGGKSGTPALALAALPMLLFGWVYFAGGIRRLRQIGGSYYVKAGPEGIALRIPGRATWSSLRFGFRTVEAELPWAQVKKYYPWVLKVNGIPTASEVRIEVDRGTYSIPAVLFRETRATIAANIKAAAK